MDSIGSRIRNARKQAGLTQAQLAERAFISESYMALIELDKRNPSTDVVIRIAEILQVSSDHLLFGELPKNELVLFNEWKKGIWEFNHLHHNVHLNFQKSTSQYSEQTQSP